MKDLLLRFLAILAIAIAASLLVGFLWSLVGRRGGALDWESSVRLGITLGLVVACAEALERLPRRRKRL